MAFDPSTAAPFDPSSATPVASFDPSTAAPVSFDPSTATPMSLGDILSQGNETETQAGQELTSKAGKEALEAAAMNYTPAGLVPQIAGGLAGIGKSLADVSGLTDVAN